MAAFVEPHFDAWTQGSGNMSVVDKVPPEMLHMVHPHWNQFSLFLSPRFAGCTMWTRCGMYGALDRHQHRNPSSSVVAAALEAAVNTVLRPVLSDRRERLSPRRESLRSLPILTVWAIRLLILTSHRHVWFLPPPVEVAPSAPIQRSHRRRPCQRRRQRSPQRSRPLLQRKAPS